MTTKKHSLSDLNFSDTADQGSDMVVVHPTARTPLIADDGQPVTIRLVGIDSDTYLKAGYANRDQNIEEMRRGAKYSAAADDYKGAQVLAKCTLGWHGVPKGWLNGTRDDDMAEFSYENALAMWENRGVRWLREQADQYVADRAHFLKASSKT